MHLGTEWVPTTKQLRRAGTDNINISKPSAFVGKKLVWSTATLEQYTGSKMLVATYICVKSLAKTSTEKCDSLFI